MKKLSKIFPILFIIAGISIAGYPKISNWIHEKFQKQEIVEYESLSSQMSVKEIKANLEAAKTYNKKLADNHALFYYPEQLEGYYEIINLSGNGVMGYLSIAKLNISLPIYHGTDDSVLQKGAGHIEGSSFPIGGTSEHAVIAAHRGLPSAELFSNLDKMEIGDTFTIRILNRSITYIVDQIEVVEPTDQSLELIEDGKSYCTLLTCTPYGINSHRLLVRGKLESVELMDRIQTSDNKIGQNGVGNDQNPLKKYFTKSRGDKR